MCRDRLIGSLLLVFFQVVFLSSAARGLQTEGAGIENLLVHWKANDLRRLQNGSYQVVGADPFLYTQDQIGHYDDIQGFLFKIRLSGGTDHHHLQWYWETDSHTFSEKYSFHCVLKGKKKDFTVFIPLYFFHTRNNINRIRLDIDPKTDQALSILSVAIVRHVEPWLLNFIPEGTGLVRIDDPEVFINKISGRTVDVPINIEMGWIPHDIQRGENNTFRITGNDPYLESPLLNLNLNGSQGLYLEITGDTQERSCQMQMFWKSYLLDYPIEKETYAENESYWFWLEMKKGRASVYLPFDPINPVDVLKRIRLDFFTCKSMVFRIQQAKLTGNQSREYRRFLPAQASFHTMAALPERNNMELTVPWQKLLFRDRSFWIVFTSVVFALIAALVLTCVCYIKAKRKNRAHR